MIAFNSSGPATTSGFAWASAALALLRTITQAVYPTDTARLPTRTHMKIFPLCWRFLDELIDKSFPLGSKAIKTYKHLIHEPRF
jgi:hypothetical protein